MLKFIILFFFITIFFCSCVHRQKVIYFNNLSDQKIETEILNLEPVIQKNDILSINVSSLNSDATKVFNPPNNIDVRSSRIDGSLTQPVGYLVSQDGFIDFPVLGVVKAAGFSKKEFKHYLTKQLVDRKLLIDPIVDIRYLNYRVTVLGEVGRPSVLSVPNERITLLEALGLAGDLTIFAQRSNVMIVREEEGAKIIKRINLNSSELFTSPYYYLRANDIVYVEPNKTKISSSSQTRVWLPVVLSAISVATIVIDRLTR
jgi:polysaccharide biosynthesis/export protein